MRRYLAVAMVFAGPAHATDLQPVAALAAGAESFADAPVTVDPRLLLPACAAPLFAWAPGGRSVAASCAAPAWRVFLPLAGGHAAAVAEAAPSVRRGDQVMVEAMGDGFSVGMEAIAEADAAGGRVALRNVVTGRRIIGSIGADGVVTIHGLSGVVNRR